MAEGNIDERRILLLGKVGAGKSATGNAIIGNNVFLSRKSFMPVTDKCSFANVVRNEKKYVVCDTPGVDGLTEDKKKSLDTLKRCLYVTCPGFHAIVYVISADQRFQESDKEMFQQFQKLLKDNYKYTILVFTNIETAELYDMINECKEIKDLCTKCNDRYLCFGNSINVDTDIIYQFDQQLENLICRNNIYPFFIHPLFSKAYGIITEDAEELKENHGYSYYESMTLAREKAFNGQSPRDDTLIELSSFCVII